MRPRSRVEVVVGDQASQGLLSAWLQRRRIAAAREHLHGTVLDVGCGNGGLAALVASADYRGWDRNEGSLALARERFPAHRFSATAPTADEQFDTVACLAVIEHIPDPGVFLAGIVSRITPGGRVVLTTPHPAFEWIHDVGASVGIFSRDANEEHEALLDEACLAALAREAGLRMTRYRRFLLGANQLAIFERP